IFDERLYGYQDNVYYRRITIREPTQSFNVMFDTGSDILWIPGMFCQQSECKTKQKYDNMKDNKYKLINQQNWKISYGGGPVLGKIQASSDLNVNAPFLTNQPFYIVDQINSDGFSSPIDGIFGLFYQLNKLKFISSLKEQGLINSGQFAFKFGRDGESLSHLMIALVDTGNTYSWVPQTDDAKKLYDQIPGSKLNNNLYYLPCDSKIKISIKINSMIWNVDSRDMVDTFNILNGLCQGGIQPNEDNKKPVTFNLNDGTSKTLHLDAPDVILIKKENFIKFLNIVKPNEKKQITIDDDEDHESRMGDSTLEVSDITDQETNLGSSFIMFEKGSTNNIEKAGFSYDDDCQDEADNTLSTLQPSSIKENARQQSNTVDNTQDPSSQGTISNDKELLQNDSSHSDKYSDMEEEIDELIFDSLVSSPVKRSKAISLLKGNLTKTRSQTKINENFKTTKKIKKNSNSNDKVTAKRVNDDELDRVPSDLTNDSLPSISEVLGQSFVAKIAKRINENTNLSQTSNNSEFGESALGSQLNNEHINNQETNEMEILSDLGIHDNAVRANVFSIPSNNKLIIKDQNSMIQPESIENNQNEQYNSIPINDSQYPIVLITEVPESIDSDDPINISSNDDSNNDESLSISSNDPFSEKGTPKSIENNQNEQKSKCKSDYDSREQDKGKKVELSESSSDSDGNINISTTYSNNLKAPSEYIKNLKKIRTKKGMNGSTSISLEPLPKHLQVVADCHNYLRIWNLHYDQCEKEINYQHTKTLNLVYSLSQLFFFLLKYCKQEQENEIKVIHLRIVQKAEILKAA
ncbi:13451_t:CDS:10, partial [Gigaspora margarita]